MTTLKAAKDQLASIGIRLEPKNEWGEYRVTYAAMKRTHEKTERSAYYTADLEDAIATGFEMAGEKMKARAWKGEQ
jgi:hypothetical protein